MADDIAIKVEGLGKRYRLGNRAGYSTLRESLTQAVRAPLRKLGIGRAPVAESSEDLWAVKDVNFEIKRGEAVGIIGRNGAGKSTLLKLLSRITEPTTGSIEMTGRVGSLLEVGTGFHPELTGRENIYLNGAILGMSRVDIHRRFDEIVAFSEVERFLDTPVKRYSSGMYMRLAFAVAAHLEPDILVVDEVLAVGDSSFQKKCLGMMGEVARHGRTVLFVSHNLTAISSLCRSAIVMKAGQLLYRGPASDAVRRYEEEANRDVSGTLWEGNEGDENARLLRTCVKPSEGSRFLTSQDIEISIEIEVLRPIQGLVLGFRLFSTDESTLAYCLYDDCESAPPDLILPSRLIKRFLIPANTLADGAYKVGIALGIHNRKTIVLNTHGNLRFHVENLDGLGRRFLTAGAGFSSIFRPDWSIRE